VLPEARSDENKGQEDEAGNHLKVCPELVEFVSGSPPGVITAIAKNPFFTGVVGAVAGWTLGPYFTKFFGELGKGHAERITKSRELRDAERHQRALDEEVLDSLEKELRRLSVLLLISAFGVLRQTSTGGDPWSNPHREEPQSKNSPWLCKRVPPMYNMTRCSHVLMALACAAALGSSAFAQATAQQFTVKDKSLMGRFVCTNDPEGVKTTVFIFSAKSVLETSGPPTASSFTGIELRRYDDSSGTTVFQAAGYSLDISPEIAPDLSSASVTGSLFVDVTTSLDYVPVTFAFSINAVPGRPTRFGPLDFNEDFGTYREILDLYGVQRAASGSGTVTVSIIRDTQGNILSCPLRSVDDTDFPNQIARFSEGTVTIAPKEQ
jgi:hypothetical protein